MKNYKILLLNFGYARGWDGSLKSFFKTLHRLPFQFFFQRKKELKKLEKIIKEENPDLILLAEVENKKCMEFLSKLGYPFWDMDIKYGPESLYRKIPAWHNNSNAFLSKEEIDFKKIFFSQGAKKLIYDIVLPNKETHLFFAHFSLVDKTRKNQLKEISEIMSQHKNSILVGDFNIKFGIKELDEIKNNLNLKISSEKPTYPAYKPTKTFDLLLAPKDLDLKTKIFYGENMSDHLPVLFELSLNEKK